MIFIVLPGKEAKSEDYVFIQQLDYAAAHDDYYQTIKLEYGENKDCQCTAYWFPNYNSLSRTDKHYSQHLAGWTMSSSNRILDFCESFNEKYGYEDEEDETMKHRFLNMTIYGFYNLLDFLKEVASTDYIPEENDWYVLRDNVLKLKNRLYDKYWKELVYSDIEDELYHVKHYSDIHFTESWIGTFYDFMNNEIDILSMNYEEMISYCGSLKFDAANHEVNASYVKAWKERHENKFKK